MAVSPEVRLKRYLYYTNEANIYLPGCRHYHKRYTRENVPSLGELLADKKHNFIFDLVETIHKENKSCYPDALLYVLSEMARDKELRPKALEIAETLCEKVESFIVFLKFSLENSPKMGFGRSFRNFIRNWYVSKDHLKLAEIVGEMKKYRGWRHCDLMRLAHVKTSEPAKAACFKYAVSGLKDMEKEYGDNEEAKKVVSYLTTVETYRKKTDPVEVAGKIESYLLGIEHVNFVLLEDKKVWLALLKQMPVLQVLNHFQFMSKRKMFRNSRNWDFIFVDTVIEALTKPYSNRIGVSANRVFIELMNYENAGRVKLELATKIHQTSKKPPILNSDLINALTQLMITCIEDVKPTGKKFMLAIELSQEMLKRRCNVARYITLMEAAGFLAYYLLHTEVSVKLFTFNGTGLKQLSIAKEATIKQLIDNLKSENIPEGGSKNKGDEHIINWLKEHCRSGGSEEVDVCIILRSYMDNNSLHGLTSGGSTNKKIRFVVSDLCGIPKSSKPPDRRNLFVTSGFDEKLTEAITLFASEAF